MKLFAPNYPAPCPPMETPRTYAQGIIEGTILGVGVTIVLIALSAIYMTL